jgi:UDP:flavonoid glycosyltransferase YjiC (YdhE family)
MKADVRAVLLIGSDPRNRPNQPLPESICLAEYAPYSALFPRAAMVVHQGGVGTTAQCLQAGKPMLIMPYSHDQPDNARRMRRLNVAFVIRRDEYRPLRVARKVCEMLEEPKFAQRAQSVARTLAREDGVRTACDALEELWNRTRKTASSSQVHKIIDLSS